MQIKDQVNWERFYLLKYWQLTSKVKGVIRMPSCHEFRVQVGAVFFFFWKCQRWSKKKCEGHAANSFVYFRKLVLFPNQHLNIFFLQIENYQFIEMKCNKPDVLGIKFCFKYQNFRSSLLCNILVSWRTGVCN